MVILSPFLAASHSSLHWVIVQGTRHAGSLEFEGRDFNALEALMTEHSAFIGAKAIEEMPRRR